MLVFTEDNVRILTENQAIFAVVEAMKTHSNSPELLEAASAVILSLSMEGTFNILRPDTMCTSDPQYACTKEGPTRACRIKILIKSKMRQRVDSNPDVVFFYFF